ncbi:MAG: lipopolysaccharide biosynthesis protein [Oscillospiraceae bacterium]|nr:lipopolysaccharide biosynthesis protein [Oscillospiraceae bacterium]
MKKSEVKYGALLSYVLIFANTFYGLIVTPFMLGQLGTSEYGVYKTIGGMVAVVSVLEMGIGATMQRYIARFNADNKREQAENFSAMGLIQALLLAVAMLILGAVLYPGLEETFSVFTTEEMNKAKQIFGLMILQVALHMFENFYFGVIAGYNRFIFSNTLKLILLVLRVLLYYVFLPVFPDSVTIVCISLFLEIIVIAVEILYLRLGLKHRVRLKKWDPVLFKDSFVYTILLFVQSLIIQFNGHVDSIVIGSVMGTVAVTLYSFALQMFNMYEQCATSISGVLLPTVTKKLVEGARPKDLESLVIKYGRAQWMFLGGALGGILCCGKEFFLLWLGKKLGPDAVDCWKLCLILVIPVTLPLITNTCLTILKAKNKLGVRTITMGCSVVVNIILTYFGTKLWGYWAAAAGTAASTFLGSVIAMNIYYHKELELHMLRIYGSILRRITPCILMGMVPCLILNCFLWGSWLSFLLKVALFLLVYGGTLLCFGLSRTERKAIPFLKGRSL